MALNRRSLDASNDLFGAMNDMQGVPGNGGGMPFRVPPPPPSFPMAPPPEAPTGAPGSEGRNAESPRERRPAQELTPPDISRVSQAAGAADLGGNAPQPPMAGGAPGQPMEPTPTAEQPPQPFTPMPSAAAQPGAAAGIGRVPLGGAAPASPSLFGKAGGMLGGGLGVPGTSSAASPDISHLMNLLKLLGVQ